MSDSAYRIMEANEKLEVDNWPTIVLIYCFGIAICLSLITITIRSIQVQNEEAQHKARMNRQEKQQPIEWPFEKEAKAASFFSCVFFRSLLFYL